MHVPKTAILIGYLPGGKPEAIALGTPKECLAAKASADLGKYESVGFCRHAKLIGPAKPVSKSSPSLPPKRETKPEPVKAEIKTEAPKINPLRKK